jgi:hypothetical protein
MMIAEYVANLALMAGYGPFLPSVFACFKMY